MLVVVPGPSVLFTVGRALAHGRRSALMSVAGNTTGVAMVVLVHALGYGAVLPQFVDLTAGNAGSQMLVLGLLFAALASTLDGAWALVAGWARDWFTTSPTRLRWLGGTGGVLMVLMGMGLAVSGRPE